MDVRVRFAPSPTGPLHIGGVRTALYNYLFARKHGGKMLLRIEDTDQKRYVPGAEDYIVQSLAWCGIEIDEGVSSGGELGPYRQSERKELYREYAELLIEKGFAYYAFDTPEDLDEMRKRVKAQGVPNPQYNSITRQYMKNSVSLSSDEVNSRLKNGDPYVVRIKMPRNEEVKINDIIRSWVVVNSTQLDDKVLFKSDGMPTYHLANVVDDHLMKITHVIRGEEWLPSTPLHVLLYKYFGWEDTMPQFAHLPLLLRPDGNGKLSKRDGDIMGFPVYPIEWDDPKSGEKSSGYRERGFLKDSFINMLSFLGWHPSDNQEIFSMNELIESFSLERVSKAGAKFDYEKAKWFNQQYILRMDGDILLKSLNEQIEGINHKYDRAQLEKICALLKERVQFVSELKQEALFFFEAPKT
ncbi:MAG TPA: glutamate--tRNA ligase, partial [Bacteroidetes bacterium]|nr:glutamate--tRNA ligase [Bacteroidota bacterium]